MLKYTLKSVVGRLNTLWMSLVAVTLAVAFVAGALIFTRQLEEQHLHMALSGQPDLTVAATGALDPERQDIAQISYDDDDVDALAALDGVARAEPALITHAMSFDNADGTSAVGVTPVGAVAWTDMPSVSGTPIIDAEKEPAAHEVLLSSQVLDSSGYEIGDTVEFTILPTGGDYATHTVKATISGTAEIGGTGAYVIFNHDVLSELITTTEQIWVELESEADQQAVARQISDTLAGSEAVSAQTAAEYKTVEIAQTTAMLKPLVIGFAVIAVIVAALMIVNTLSILVVQRTRELALLRALGASGSQIGASVTLESLILGVVGSVAGVLVGWGLAVLLAVALQIQSAAIIPTVSQVVLSMGIGVIMTVLASLLPALRASRISPVVAIQGTREHTARKPRHLTVEDDARVSVNRLAWLNITRQLGRTLTTASTLAIGMVLVGVLAVAGASWKGSLEQMVPEMLGSDLIMLGEEPMAAEQLDQLRDKPEVERIYPHELSGASFAGDQDYIVAIPPEHVGTMIRQDIVEGTAPQAAGELMVTSQTATKNDLAVGDHIDGVLNGEPLTWHVVGIFEYPPNISFYNYVISPDTLREAGLPAEYNLLAIDLTSDADIEAAKTSLAEVVKKIPGASLLDAEDFNGEFITQVDQMLLVGYGLVAISLMIATLSIINTLALSITERRRELGLLRAVGMTDAQVRGLVARESVGLSLVGGLIGLALGGALGLWAATLFEVTVIPWLHLVVALAGLILVGLLASLIPAGRACRTPILQAIAGR